MNNNNEIPEYLLIKNPYTGTHVNVLPLFKSLAENHCAEPGSFDNFILPLQEAQDFMATEVHLEEYNQKSVYELNSVNYNIVRIRKVFQAMAKPV